MVFAAALRSGARGRGQELITVSLDGLFSYKKFLKENKILQEIKKKRIKLQFVTAKLNHFNFLTKVGVTFGMCLGGLETPNF